MFVIFGTGPKEKIEAEGKFGKLKIILENNPSSNPKTSRLTAMSVILTLSKRKNSFLCSF